jgi:hypothetical protein
MESGICLLPYCEQATGHGRRAWKDNHAWPQSERNESKRLQDATENVAELFVQNMILPM